MPALMAPVATEGHPGRHRPDPAPPGQHLGWPAARTAVARTGGPGWSGHHPGRGWTPPSRRRGRTRPLPRPSGPGRCGRWAWPARPREAHSAPPWPARPATRPRAWSRPPPRRWSPTGRSVRRCRAARTRPGRRLRRCGPAVRPTGVVSSVGRSWPRATRHSRRRTSADQSAVSRAATSPTTRSLRMATTRAAARTTNRATERCTSTAAGHRSRGRLASRAEHDQKRHRRGTAW